MEKGSVFKQILQSTLTNTEKISAMIEMRSNSITQQNQMNVKPWLIDHLSNNNTRNSKSIQSQAYNQQKSRQQSKLANLT